MIKKNYAEFGTVCALFLLHYTTSAQTFTRLYNFSPKTTASPFTNNDGANPRADLILSGNTIYGTASTGGTNGRGTVFRVNIGGIGFTNLHNFGFGGSLAYGNLILSGNTLFGTTEGGGASSAGIIFSIGTDGANFTVLHNFSALTRSVSLNVFTNTEGADPFGGLILIGNTLYGAATRGGFGGHGTIFSFNPSTLDYTNLYNFTSFPEDGSTNGDGAFPNAGMILSGNMFYGTTSGGGTNGDGTVFGISIDGTGFTNLHTFSGADGSGPQAGLVMLGNYLYGTTQMGGTSGFGTIFKVDTNGMNFTNIYFFNLTNGALPVADLTISGGQLFGTTQHGGANLTGNIFSLSSDGSSFTNIYSFTALSNSTNADGAVPQAGVLISSNILYGTAAQGGIGNVGTVFSLTLNANPPTPPQLNIATTQTGIVLLWPTNPATFNLESATNLVSPVVWSTNNIAPGQVNGQNAITNPISGTRMFFRLIQN